MRAFTAVLDMPLTARANNQPAPTPTNIVTDAVDGSLLFVTDTGADLITRGV